MQALRGVQRPLLRPLAPARRDRPRAVTCRASAAGAAAVLDPGAQSGQPDAASTEKKSGLLSWWHVEAEGRDGKVQPAARHKFSTLLSLVGELISKVRLQGICRRI
jgi:hypothetical protein